MLPPEDFLKKWVYPWRISQKKAFTPEEFQEISVYPWRIPHIIWVLPLKTSLASGLYPWRIPPLLSLTPEEFHCSSTGGGGADIKWNSPIYAQIITNILADDCGFCHLRKIYKSFFTVETVESSSQQSEKRRFPLRVFFKTVSRWRHKIECEGSECIKYGLELSTCTCLKFYASYLQL